MRRTPLVPVALALMAGMLAARAMGAEPLWIWMAVLAAASLAGGLIWMLKRTERESYVYITLLVACMAIGALRWQGDDRRHWSHRCPEKAYLTLRLKESPVPRARSWRALAEVEAIDNQSCYGALKLYLRRDSTAATLRYGDRLLVHGYTDTTKRWLYTTSDHYLLIGRDSTSFHARCEALRMSLLRRMQAGPLDHRHAGVAEAMTLGWRGDLEEDLQAQFRNSGIIHLLCVSGLHVGMLAALVGGLLVWLGKERRGRILRGSLQIIAIWAFALLTGMAPATTRAALMFSLFFISYMLARRTDTMNLLAAAAIVTLTIEPTLLLDTSWQLSFSAVTGILLMRSLIRRTSLGIVRGILVSLGATIGTLPIIIATFHQFPLYSLISNIIILPFAAPILALSLAYLAVPCAVTAAPLSWLLSGCNWLTDGISRLPYATIGNLHPTPFLTALLAVAAFLLLALLGRRRE